MKESIQYIIENISMYKLEQKFPISEARLYAVWVL